MLTFVASDPRRTGGGTMTANRLLVVDDDAATRWALRSIFTRRGWDVTLAETVATGMLALDLAPHCVILDLTLPDGSGETILQAIRSRGLTTRVAVCSSTTDPVRVATVMALRPEVLLAKPYDLGPVMHLCEMARSA